MIRPRQVVEVLLMALILFSMFRLVTVEAA